MADVRNWQELSRAIVKLIRDQYGIDEAILKRTAVLETDIGLSIDQVEAILDYITETFEIRFPAGTLNEVLKLEELCLLACWLKGYYKQPTFIS
ncbi:acyl carrier protein, partial [Elstera litoralis]